MKVGCSIQLLVYALPSYSRCAQTKSRPGLRHAQACLSVRVVYMRSASYLTHICPVLRAHLGDLTVQLFLKDTACYVLNIVRTPVQHF